MSSDDMSSDNRMEPLHFLIRAASHIEGKSSTVRRYVEQARRELGRAEKELDDLDALRAQILVVAQKLSGVKHPDIRHIACGNTATCEIDRDLFREVCEDIDGD